MWWLHSILQAPPTTFSVGFSCPINRKTNGELAMAFSLHATLPHANPVPPYFPKLRDQILTRRLRFSSCRKAHACFILLGRKVRLIATRLALPPEPLSKHRPREFCPGRGCVSSRTSTEVEISNQSDLARFLIVLVVANSIDADCGLGSKHMALELRPRTGILVDINLIWGHTL